MRGVVGTATEQALGERIESLALANRHTRATLLRRVGGATGAAYLLGHRNISTTDKYVDADYQAGVESLAMLGNKVGQPEQGRIEMSKAVRRRGLEPPRDTIPPEPERGEVAGFTVDSGVAGSATIADKSRWFRVVLGTAQQSLTLPQLAIGEVAGRLRLVPRNPSEAAEILRRAS